MCPQFQDMTHTRPKQLPLIRGLAVFGLILSSPPSTFYLLPSTFYLQLLHSFSGECLAGGPQYTASLITVKCAQNTYHTLSNTFYTYHHTHSILTITHILYLNQTYFSESFFSCDISSRSPPVPSSFHPSVRVSFRTQVVFLHQKSTVHR